MDICIATPKDIYGIRRVQRVTWLNTYPNKEIGITKEDIRARFDIDKTNEGKAKMAQRKERMKNPNQRVWIVKDNEKIVGFCMANIENNCNRISAIYVLPKYHGKGIGRKLMETGLNWLGTNKDILINVASYNEKAINFYKKFGFIINRKNIIDDMLAPFPSGVKLPESEMIKKIKQF